jgi:aminoglycoside 2''-phosphotransferase
VREASFVLSPEAAVALIHSHVPEYIVVGIEAMGHQGWGGDSDAFTVNGRDIFRFPRSLAVRENLAVEVRLLPLLEPTLPLPIPHFTQIAIDPDGGPPLFVGYPRIEGEQLSPERFTLLTAQARAAFARQIGEFIGALHRFPVSIAREAGVRFVADARADLVQFRTRVRTQLFPLLNSDEQNWVHGLFTDVLNEPDVLVFDPVLCHKDLSGDHILYDPERATLTGVIDFGDRRIMDPMVDFAGLENEYGRDFCAAALTAAGYRFDEPLERRLLFYSCRGPLFEMLYGLDEGLPLYIEEGRQRLRAMRKA